METKLGVNHLSYSLIRQHRSIKPIADMYSDLFYNGALRTDVQETDRPRAGLAKSFHAKHFRVDHALLVLNVPGNVYDRT